MEGFLPLEWCVFWALLATPVVLWGAVRIRRMFREQPDRKLMMAVSGAFIFVISSLKLPSVTGSSSHPTGTGIGTVLYGVGITSVLATIVLIFQAMLLAHGGLTTLGANVFSMGIAGPLAAFAVYKGLRKLRVGVPAGVFTAALVADLVTYIVTAVQLSLAFPTNGHFLPSLQVFLGVYAITQVPLAVMEAILTVMFFSFLSRSRPDLMDLGGSLKPSRLSRKVGAALTAITVLAVVAALLMVRVGGLEGSDQAGTDLIVTIDPDFVPWASSGIVLDEAGEMAMFAIQGIIGLIIILYAWRTWRLKEGKKEPSPSIPLAQRWPPLGKLLLTLSLLLVSLVSRSIIVPAIVLAIGIALLLISSRSRLPRAILLALTDGLLIVAVGALIITLVTGGDTAYTLWIGSFGVVFTEQGLSLAALVFMRAAAGISVMLFFASSTPIPHLAQALRQLRVPKELAELVILIYRYSFLVLEQYEKMMVAAHCRLGLRGFRTTLRTLSKVAVGVLVRSIGAAERAQVSLQCRNFRGDFPAYREPARMNVLWFALPAMAFVSLYTLNIMTGGA